MAWEMPLEFGIIPDSEYTFWERKCTFEILLFKNLTESKRLLSFKSGPDPCCRTREKFYLRDQIWVKFDL